MSEPRAQRTLVKSPPELWAEVSDVSVLARHLGEFGEIKITRLEAETTVVWEGDRARGTVSLEPSGWGTKVTLTAEAIAAEPDPEPAPEPEAAPEPEPAAVVEEPEPEPPRKVGFFARLRARRRPAPVVLPEPEPEPEPVVTAPEAIHVPTVAGPEPAAVDAGAVEAVLVGVLDDLGAAHHRPFSRG
jgi:hypothetical protein